MLTDAFIGYLQASFSHNLCWGLNRNHLKNVFWPNIFVGDPFQILDIQQYASGLKLLPAAILDQNLIFEMASG
jgi:hypothetical protein